MEKESSKEKGGRIIVFPTSDDYRNRERERERENNRFCVH
jgi:hypothetical protein